jgi:hypothetical protein
MKELAVVLAVVGDDALLVGRRGSFEFENEESAMATVVRSSVFEKFAVTIDE